MANNKTLIKTLKNHHLREATTPRADWAVKTRALLIARAEEENVARADIKRTTLNIFFVLFDPKAVKRATVALTMVAFVFSSFVGVVSATNSLPGDTLYGVKIAAEKARIGLAPNKHRPLLRTESAGRRLKEMLRISNAAVSVKKEKAQRVKKAVTIFNEELQNVGKDLAVLRTAGSDSEVATAAGAVDKKMDEYITILQEHEARAEKPVRSEIKRAKQGALQASVKTVEVVVETSAQSGELKEEATKTVGNKLLVLENQIADLAPMLVATSTPLTILSPAKDAIVTAKNKLAENDLLSAFSLLAKSSELVAALEDGSSNAGALSESLKKAATTTPTEQKPLLKAVASAPIEDSVKIDLFFDSGS